MGAWGSPTLKPTRCWGTAPWSKLILKLVPVSLPGSAWLTHFPFEAMVAEALPFSWKATAQNDYRKRQEIADRDQKEKVWWFNVCADALANQSCIPGLLVSKHWSKLKMKTSKLTSILLHALGLGDVISNALKSILLATGSRSTISTRWRWTVHVVAFVIAAQIAHCTGLIYIAHADLM